MTGEKNKPRLVTTTDNKRVLVMNQTEDEYAEMSYRKNPNVSVEYNANHRGKFDFITYSGATIDSYYGYAAAFDAISRPFAIALTNGEYESAIECQVYYRMTEQYQKIVGSMGKRYSAEFSKERLHELKEVYSFLFEMNVYQSIFFCGNRLFSIHTMLESLRECLEEGWKSKVPKDTSSADSLKSILQYLRDKSRMIEDEEELKTILILFASQDKEQNDCLRALSNRSDYNVKPCIELIQSRKRLTLPFMNQYGKDESLIHMRYKRMARIKQVEDTFQLELLKLKGISAK